MIADHHTAYGHLLDFLLIDEITNWPDSAEKLWDALISTVPKRRHCLCVIISNAGVGMGSSWQWRIREACSADPAWYFSRIDGPTASWITQDLLDEQRRLLPEVAFRRLWLNQWTTGSGDAVSLEDVEACFARDMEPMACAESNYAFIGGLDLAASRDFSAFVIVGKSRTGRYRVARCWLWKPPVGGRIDLEQIERTIADAHKQFRLTTIAADPYQGEYLIARLRKANVPITPRPQTGKALVEQCMFLVEQMTSRNLDAYEFEPLRHDLVHLRVEERSYGLRLVAERGLHGHGDVATALTLTLVAAKTAPTGGAAWGGVVWSNDGTIGGRRFAWPTYRAG